MNILIKNVYRPFYVLNNPENIFINYSHATTIVKTGFFFDVYPSVNYIKLPFNIQYTMQKKLNTEFFI